MSQRLVDLRIQILSQQQENNHLFYNENCKFSDLRVGASSHLRALVLKGLLP